MTVDISAKDKPFWDLRHVHGPFDLIGDVHGCAGELEALLEKLGYQVIILPGTRHPRKYHITPPEGRRAIFLGDLTDRGPRSEDVLSLVMGMVASGAALCILGNHDHKLLQMLDGKNINLKHGRAETKQQLARCTPDFMAQIIDFLRLLSTHHLLDEGRLAIAHAGLMEDMHQRTDGKARAQAMYGVTTGERDEFDFPVREDWVATYTSAALMVYGHTPMQETEFRNNTICLDTGCCFGGKLSALRYPERAVVQVRAVEVYQEPKKPL